MCHRVVKGDTIALSMTIRDTSVVHYAHLAVTHMRCRLCVFSLRVHAHGEGRGVGCCGDMIGVLIKW